MIDIEFLSKQFIKDKPFDFDWILKTAYTDIQVRTITGHTPEVQAACVAYLKNAFEPLIDTEIADFDTKHAELCEGFLDVINKPEHKIDTQNYGKAQKVINIIFKFLVAYGKCKNVDDCHVPIDSFVLRWLYKSDKYQGAAWSNLSYEQYTRIQTDILDKIKSPIQVEAKECTVSNRIEADYFIWYITKVAKNYKDTYKSINALTQSVHEFDTECVDKKTAERIMEAAVELYNKLKALSWENET